MANWISHETGALLNARMAVWCLARGHAIRLVGGESPTRPLVLPNVVYGDGNGTESMYEGTRFRGKEIWNGWHRLTRPDGTVERTLVVA